MSTSIITVTWTIYQDADSHATPAEAVGRSGALHLYAYLFGFLYNARERSTTMYDVAIQNVTGYAGLGAAQLVQNHPDFSLVSVSGRSDAGKRLSDVFPFWLGPELQIEEQVPAVDLILCCLPHGAAA